MLTRGRIILLGVTLFSTYAYFYQAGGWNQDSRFDMVRAIVERGTLKITAYHHNTGDKSRVGTEYYSDKAPGHALLAVPFVATARGVMKLAGVDPLAGPSLMWLLYLSALATAALPAALMVVGFLWLARRLGASEGGALFGGMVLGLGTPIAVYATLFQCHALAAALLFFALMAAVALRDPAGAVVAVSGRRRRVRDGLLGLAVGVCAGWATISEYPAAVTAVLLTGLALAQVHRDGWRRLAWVAGGITLGALPCAAVMMAYNQATFGSPFSLSYQHQVNFAPVSELFALPNGSNLGLSLFGEFRGLLPLSPVLVASPLGIGLMLLGRPRAGAGGSGATGASRVGADAGASGPGGTDLAADPAAEAARSQLWKGVATLCWIVPAYYFLLNSSYAGWFGGWCYGPRNVASALPYLALPLALVWTYARPLLRGALLATGLYGMALAVLAAAVTAQPPANQPSPIAKLWWANFKLGKFSLFPGAWNWGQRFDLPGQQSLIPLLILWLLATLTWLSLPHLPKWLRHLRSLRLRLRPRPPLPPSPSASPSPSPSPDPLTLDPSPRNLD